jgi:urea transporter
MTPKELADILLRGMGQIMLQDNALTGALFLLGILVNSWQMFLAALLGVLSGTVAAHLLKYSKEDIVHGLYGFNAALVGVGLLFFFQPGALLVLLIIAGSALSTMIMNFMHKRKMSPYTFPFILSTWIIIALVAATGILPSQPSSPIPLSLDILSALSMGFSQVVFQANILTGIIFLAAILVNSRANALYTLLGSLVGMLFALALSFPLGLISIGIFGYNGVLCGAAFSGAKKHALAFAVAATAISVLMVYAFPLISTPALTAPFVFATWIMLALGKKL